MQKFIKALEKVQIVIGILFLCIFFCVIVLQIITRHLDISIIWTEEAATYSFIWSVFMGAAVMVNRREHFNFDFLLNKLRKKTRTLLSLFNDMVLIFFNICILLLGLQIVSEFWNYTWSTIPDVKMGYVWLAIPIMAGTMLIYTFSHIVQHVQNLRDKEVQE